METTAPLLSIITPCFNHAPYIRQTIESVLAQEYPHVEHIVVDGASTDGTVAILQEYGERYPERFRWVSEPDRGQAHAFNKGLAMARGQIIGWQNSDDYYLPNAFADPVAYFTSHPDVAVVYGDCRLVDASGTAIGQWPVGPFDFGRLLYASFVANQSAFMLKDALVSVGGVNEHLHQAMDLDLWLRLALSHRFAYLHGLRGAYRFLPTAKSHAGLLRSRRETLAVVEHLRANPLLPADLIPDVEQAILFHAQEALMVALAEHDPDLASSALSKMLLLDPLFCQWRPLCKRMLMRRVMTTEWYGILHHQLTTRLPMDLYTLMRDQAPDARMPLDQIVALAQLFRALDQPSRRGAAAYFVDALRRDRGLLRYPATILAVLRLICGDAAIDRLNPTFTGLRGVIDHLASGRSLTSFVSLRLARGAEHSSQTVAPGAAAQYGGKAQ